ncbi:MAG TPA: class I SAM-dependent methyltransferase [Herpetosiphonaceae bacterium]
MTSTQAEEQRIRSMYEQRFRVEARNYGYQWHPRNPVAQFYHAERDAACAALLNRHQIHLDGQLILDVGCGAGGVLRMLMEWGADPELLYGVDLVAGRLQTAHRRQPAMRLVQQTATALPCADQAFDIVTQWTMFSSLLDPAMRRAAAGEIERVLRPGGWLLWYDLLDYIDSPSVRGLDPDEVRALFPGCEPVALRRLHHRFIPRLAPRSPLLAQLLNAVPGLLRTNALMLLRRTG